MNETIHLLCVYGEARAKLGHDLLGGLLFSQYHLLCLEAKTQYMSLWHTNIPKKKKEKEKEKKKEDYLNNIFVSIHLQ